MPPAARAPLTSVSIRPNPAHATALLDIITNGEVVVDIEVYNVVGSRAILQLGGVQVASGASAIPLDVTILTTECTCALYEPPKAYPHATSWWNEQCILSSSLAQILTDSCSVRDRELECTASCQMFMTYPYGRP
ncbi:MAG: hypothetical protein HRU79_08750 [Ignavibacteria bacterium]|nr:MAG: hypothetical protein HRU79_08750 [Ignavibacteria bacterium]